MNNSYIPLKFKVSKDDKGKMSFTAYGNVKNIKDHAWDIAVDGCYQASIDKHKAEGTMPRLLWSHNPYELPVGKITHMEEDAHGLKFEGELTDTDQGVNIYKSLKHGSLDSFSIGYRVIKEEWNGDAQANLLMEIDLKEISFVNFACNEASLLESVKSKLSEGETLSKADLRNILEQSPIGLSKRQIERVTANYNPKMDTEITELKGLLESSTLFQ